MSDLICIVCPRGCHLHIDDDMNVTGNNCIRGAKYGVSELTNPTRIVTSTVKINSIELRRLPVRTNNPIPKDAIFKVMDEINKVIVNPPIKIGEVVIENVCNLGVNIIATREVDK